MPLKITLGVEPGHQRRARELLRESGADSTHKVGDDVEGIFSGISNPNGRQADKLVEWLNCEMGDRVDKEGKPYFEGIHLKEVEKA